jgi:hypothetical protein
MDNCFESACPPAPYAADQPLGQSGWIANALPRRRKRKTGLRCTALTLRNMQHFRLEPILTQVEAPTLVVRGRRDRIGPQVVDGPGGGPVAAGPGGRCLHLVMNAYRCAYRGPVIQPGCIIHTQVYAAAAHWRAEVVVPVCAMQAIIFIEEHHPRHIR